jgi:hypothetical protein
LIGVVMPMLVGRVRYCWTLAVAAGVPQLAALEDVDADADELAAALLVDGALLPHAATASESPAATRMASGTPLSLEVNEPSPCLSALRAHGRCVVTVGAGGGADPYQNETARGHRGTVS